MADLDYAEVRGRLAITVGDTDIDPDVNPDVQWCDSGTVRFTPNLSSVHVMDPVEGNFTAGNAPIEATIGPDGRLTYDDLPFVMLLDLGSDKVNPKIPREIASYKVDFLDIQSQGRSVTFASFSFHPLPDVVNDLTLLAPLPTGTGVAMVVGPQGIQGIQGEIGPIGPVGPQGIQGIQGLKGDKGDQGIQGLQGIQGIQGVKGDTGNVGPQGIQGVVGPVGPAGLEWRGVWSSGTDYAADDAVYYDFQSWFASSNPPVGAIPSDSSTYWQVLASRGAQGLQGIQGIQGEIGPTGPQGLTGPQGIQGIQGIQGVTGAAGLVWRLAWNAGTAYAVNDAVTYGGSSYRRKVEGTTAGTPTADTTNWEVSALAGTGTVNSVNGIGPVSGNVTLTNFAAIDVRTLPENVGALQTYDPLPNDIADRSVNAFFSMAYPGGSWRSALTIKGWSDDYLVWQLMGPSSNGAADDNYYLRSGKTTTWSTPVKIWHDGNLVGPVTLAGSQTITGSKTFSSSPTVNTGAGYFATYGSETINFTRAAANYIGAGTVGGYIRITGTATTPGDTAIAQFNVGSTAITGTLNTTGNLSENGQRVYSPNNIPSIATFVAGTINNAQLPTRLQAPSTNVADFNTATATGFYTANSAATNPPEAGHWWYLNVIQYVSGDTLQNAQKMGMSGQLDSAWTRQRDSAGTWSSWRKMNLTEASQDARYAQIANTVLLTGAQTIAGVKTFSNDMTLTSGTLNMANATANFIMYGGGGTGAPTFTSRSPGSKIVLYNSVAPAAADYAIGTETGHVWFSVDTASSARGWKFYGGTTLAATLTGTGNLTTVGTITAGTGFTGPGANITGVVHTTGAETVAGVKTFTSLVNVNIGGLTATYGANDITFNRPAATSYITQNGVDGSIAFILSDTVAGDITPLTLSTTGGGTITAAGAGFAGPGGGLTALNATNLSSGTVADARLSSNVALLTGAQTIAGAKTFAALREIAVAASGTSGTVTIDASTASIFTLTPTAAVTTLTISNPPASGTVCTITLKVTQGATPYTIATPAGGIFYGAATPTQVANKKCIFTYVTTDGGTTWDCSAAVQV